MSRKFKHAMAFAMLCVTASSAPAADRVQPLSDCVDLAPDRQMARFGSQYLLVKDGDTHYRIGFGGSCAAISMSTQVQIRTDGRNNRLCPSGTRVFAKRDSCIARGVMLISADKYDSYVRRAR